LPETPKLAKPVPDTVKDTDPDLGAFEFTEDIAGNLYDMEFVRIGLGVFEAPETTARKEWPAPRTTLQSMVESDFQLESAQVLLPKTSFMLMEKEPKLAPAAVTEMEPVEATETAPIEETDATSNESALETLPKREPVEIIMSLMCTKAPREIFNATEELAVQRDASV
jgi:hypothetical protein